MQTGFYQHYNGQMYELLGRGRFSYPGPEDIFVARGFHSEDRSEVSIYHRRERGILERIEQKDDYDFILVGNDRSGVNFAVYQAQYDCPDFGHRAYWVRPEDMFFATTQKDGQEVLRFMFIEPSME